MPRFFFSKKIADSKNIELSEEETHHLRVIKLRQGDIVDVTDGSSCRFKARIVDMGKTNALLTIISKSPMLKKTPLRILLGQAVPRFSKFEFILQKTTELGVNEIFPLRTQRSFLQKDAALSQNRWTRWNRIILEAAKQSGRIDFPSLHKPQDIMHFLDNSKYSGCKMCLFEEEENKENLRDVLKRINPPETVIILIGPEGGFSKIEIEKIRDCGFNSLFCGPRIMRVETAATMFISICQYEWGDL